MEVKKTANYFFPTLSFNKNIKKYLTCCLGTAVSKNRHCTRWKRSQQTNKTPQKANKAPKLILRNLNFGKDTAGTKVFHFAWTAVKISPYTEQNIWMQSKLSWNTSHDHMINQCAISSTKALSGCSVWTCHSFSLGLQCQHARQTAAEPISWNRDLFETARLYLCYLSCNRRILQK